MGQIKPLKILPNLWLCQKSSLKAGKFVPAFSVVTQPCPMYSTNTDLDDAKDNPGLYGKMIDGVGNGTHFIIASFIKTNNKIRDQLLKNFAYFSDLMCANFDGLKIHPISTGKPLPKLTSAKDANMPTTGTKVRDYFLSKIKSYMCTKEPPPES